MVVKRILLAIHNMIGRYLGISREDWHKSTFIETKDFQVLTFTSKHELSFSERVALDMYELTDQTSLNVEAILRETGDGPIIQHGMKTISLKEVEERVRKQHYERLCHQHGNKLTVFQIQRRVGGIVSSIECKTVLVKHKNSNDFARIN